MMASWVRTEYAPQLKTQQHRKASAQTMIAGRFGGEIIFSLS